MTKKLRTANEVGHLLYRLGFGAEPDIVGRRDVVFFVKLMNVVCDYRFQDHCEATQQADGPVTGEQAWILVSLWNDDDYRSFLVLRT